MECYVRDKVDTSKLGVQQIKYTAEKDDQKVIEIKTVTVVEPTLTDEELFVLDCARALIKIYKNPESAEIIAIQIVGDSVDYGRLTKIKISGTNSYGATVTTAYFCYEKTSQVYDFYDAEYDLYFSEDDSTFAPSEDYNVEYISYFLNK